MIDRQNWGRESSQRKGTQDDGMIHVNKLVCFPKHTLVKQMGLLAVLDSHKNSIEGTEIEYRLYSWGEIFPPFLGDREHSVAARFILREFPFKLFSSSTPYDDPLPQKLCLTFKAPHEVKKETEHEHISGIFAHEIAKEFAAFLSLYTRRRVFAEKQLRIDELPIEQEGEIYQRSHFQERQRLREIDSNEMYQLLDNLQALDKNIASGFVLAMRLYHSAIEMMYVDPEFAYLFLVTALETISSVINKDHKPDREDEFLNSRFPDWEVGLTEEQRTSLKDILLSNENFTFQKLLKFVTENLPEKFWSEAEDDSKPEVLTSIIGLGPAGKGEERISRTDITIQDFEKIDKEDLKKALRDVYNTRSRLVHEGVRFPESIVLGHFRRVPASVLSEMMSGGIQSKWSLKIMPLLTFERLVSYSMVEFLRKQGKKTKQGRGSGPK